MSLFDNTPGVVGHVQNWVGPGARNHWHNNYRPLQYYVPRSEIHQKLIAPEIRLTWDIALLKYGGT